MTPRVPLSKPLLSQLLPTVFEPWGMYPSQPPTDASLRRIRDALGVRLPALFVEAARACPGYGSWFGSIGEDYASHNHALTINREFHAAAMPDQYVLLNHGHDGDCDAWDTAAPADASGQLPIVYFNYDIDHRRLGGLRRSAETFADYLDGFVRDQAVRSPSKSLRRRAKRLIAAHDGLPPPGRRSK